MARFGLSLALLAQGEYEEGWREYEWRGKDGAEAANSPQFPQPPWQGQDIVGKTVLIYAEQGFGDTLQFVRYVPLWWRGAARGSSSRRRRRCCRCSAGWKVPR